MMRQFSSWFAWESTAKQTCVTQLGIWSPHCTQNFWCIHTMTTNICIQCPDTKFQFSMQQLAKIWCSCTKIQPQNQQSLLSQMTKWWKFLVPSQKCCENLVLVLSFLVHFCLQWGSLSSFLFSHSHFKHFLSGITLSLTFFSVNWGTKEHCSFSVSEQVTWKDGTFTNNTLEAQKLACPIPPHSQAISFSHSFWEEIAGPHSHHKWVAMHSQNKDTHTHQITNTSTRQHNHNQIETKWRFSLCLSTCVHGRGVVFEYAHQWYCD